MNNLINVNVKLKNGFMINIKKIEFKKIFIGVSPKTYMTTNSGSYGSQFDGNSILTKTGKNTYIFIAPKNMKE